jgi:4-hydroxybutyryl-CoA dehydratase/vinylacetyl-CoA-Delta-isomerase
MVTLPSERELRHETIGPMIEKYLKGRADIPTEDRIRILRLVENMTLGRNAVGYLTESMHGAGSPQAQRIQIARSMQIEFKKDLAKTLDGAGVCTCPKPVGRTCRIIDNPHRQVECRREIESHPAWS